MDKQRRFRTKTNATVTLLLLVGIVVLVNILSLWGFGRLDLTENQVYTLSEASKAAVAALDDLEVRVYVSKDLPEEIALGWGQKKSLRGIDRKLMDKLEEYRSYSNGQMSVTRVEEDIEKKAEAAKLRLFSAEEAKLAQGGRLEFTRYALGATFSYKNVTETLPLALEPEHYEFEVTKILLRLKEKYEEGRLMADVLDTGKALFETVQGCDRELERASATDTEDAGGLGVDLSGGAAKLAGALPAIRKACEPVAEKLAASEEKLRARNGDLDRMLDSVKQFLEFYGQLLQTAGAPEPEKQGQALQLVAILQQLYDGIDRDHDLLVNSPGRKTIGFLCGHGEFCPFPSDEPIIRPELGQLLGQQNPFLQRFLGQAQQMEEEINQIDTSIKNGLFVQRGFDIEEIPADGPIPPSIDALVVFAPTKPLSDRALYEVDQFLLSGRPVVMLTKRFDVALRNFDAEGELTVTNLTSTESNLQALLATYGIDVRADLVLEPQMNAPIVLTELVRQGQLVWQSESPFPYPLLPTFTDLNADHALVRGLANLTMPYVSSLDGSKAKAAGREVVALVRSSDKAVAKTQNIPLLPPELVAQLQVEVPNGPHDVALYVAGDFESHFKGKPEPAAAKAEGEEEKKADAPKVTKRLDTGKGRLLVVGSNLGLDELSAKQVFDGFDVAKVAQGGFEFIEGARQYAARFQNWKVRIQQLSNVLEDTVRFLPNVLDWAVQNEALLSIRSKGFIRRPLAQASPAAQSGLRYAGILSGPVLFLLFGVVRWQIRRRRRPTL